MRPTLGSLLVLLPLLASCASDAPRLRVASFNVAMNRSEAGALRDELESGESDQARRIAAILRHLRPDVVVLCEFDRDDEGRGLRAFQSHFLENEIEGSEPIHYPWVYAGPVNTGVPSGRDLDKDGKRASGGNDGARDALGYGRFPGQYGLALLSRYPIDLNGLRSFKNFRWRDLPDAELPRRADGSSWYDAGDLEVLPLSSKSHWDVPIILGDRRLHLLVSHPTPPVFDGPEDRNGCRNRDEIRFWVEHLEGSGALVDDLGRPGGLAPGLPFVILGDLNADPFDGDARDRPLAALLAHPRVGRHPAPRSLGAIEAAQLQGGANATHRGPPAEDTCDIPRDERGPGNLRLDYALPSADLELLDQGVFWPRREDFGFAWIDASDHRMVWVDLRLR